MAVTRLFDILDYYSKTYNKPDALAAKEEGKWKKYSTQDFQEITNNISYGFLKLGIQKQDKIAILANNRPEWNFIDLGVLQTGAIDVPIYPTISEHDLKFIFKDAEIKYVFVSSAELYKKIKIVSADIPGIKEIYTFNKVEGAKHWSEIAELGRQNKDEAKLSAIKASIKETELATLLYTSGTTGDPKGVMLSHKNIVSNVLSVSAIPPLDDIDNTCRALSFLPLNHIYERMLTYLYMYLGVSIYYAESMDAIADNLKEVKPEIFTTVPLLLERIYNKIIATGNELTGIKRKLFFWSVYLGLQYEYDGANGWWYEFKLNVANKLVFSKWRDGLGGNVKAIVSGGAALQARLAKIFNAARIPAFAGYGLTETSPVIAVNRNAQGERMFGTVGPVIPGVEVKIAEDGEVLSKGPHIMMGYYKHPDATAEAIDKEGWFHTGDIGELVNNKFLKITDRKKEIFKTSGGKYIAPLMIENKLKESPFVEQVMVIGDGQKFAAAFIVPSFVYIKDWYSKQGKTYTSNEEAIKDINLIAQIKEDIEKTNKTLAHYETIKKFELMQRPWSIEKGEMTPKLSLKRKVILENNKNSFEKIYS